jgi:predicted short-subunit dehydrogenase-like oxidoreductase (DUF2520 family)
MRLSIIGAGRVGQTFGRLAHEAGFSIGEVVCRTPASARRAAKFIGAGTAQTTANLELSPTDLILIATPDDQIATAVQAIQASGIRPAVVLHTSGALSSESLIPLKTKNISTGSLHPLQSFTSPRRSLKLIKQTYFCIEGDARARRVARRLVRAIGGRPFEIKTEMKSLYHAAAVLASGGVTTLSSVALDLLAHCGLKEKDAARVLLPLIEGTLTNIRAVGVSEALTGPIRRGDEGTVARNLQALRRIDRPALEIYRLLGERSLHLAEQAGTQKELLAQISKLLKGK